MIAGPTASAGHDCKAQPVHGNHAPGTDDKYQTEQQDARMHATPPVVAAAKMAWAGSPASPAPRASPGRRHAQRCPAPSAASCALLAAPPMAGLVSAGAGPTPPLARRYRWRPDDHRPPRRAPRAPSWTTRPACSRWRCGFAAAWQHPIAARRRGLLRQRLYLLTWLGRRWACDHPQRRPRGWLRLRSRSSCPSAPLRHLNDRSVLPRRGAGAAVGRRGRGDLQSRSHHLRWQGTSPRHIPSADNATVAVRTAAPGDPWSSGEQAAAADQARYTPWEHCPPRSYRMHLGVATYSPAELTTVRGVRRDGDPEVTPLRAVLRRACGCSITVVRLTRRNQALAGLSRGSWPPWPCALPTLRLAWWAWFREMHKSA